MSPENTPPVGPATVVGTVMAVLTLISAFIADARDSGFLSMDARVLAFVSLGIVVTVAFGRAYQAIYGARPVAWGWSSIGTFAGAVVSALMVALQEVTPAWADAGLDTNLLVVVAGVLTSLFAAIRQWQSGGLARVEASRPTMNVWS